MSNETLIAGNYFANLKGKWHSTEINKKFPGADAQYIIKALVSNKIIRNAKHK